MWFKFSLVCVACTVSGHPTSHPTESWRSVTESMVRAAVWPRQGTRIEMIHGGNLTVQEGHLRTFIARLCRYWWSFMSGGPEFRVEPLQLERSGPIDLC